MTVHFAGKTFDHVLYDREVDVLYLHVGEPSAAADFDESPEGHHVRFDKQGNLVGITLLHPKSILEREGKITVTLPLPEPVEIGPEVLDHVLAAA